MTLHQLEQTAFHCCSKCAGTGPSMAGGKYNCPISLGCVIPQVVEKCKETPSLAESLTKEDVEGLVRVYGDWPPQETQEEAPSPAMPRRRKR